jgi:uncharacterized membrane protein
MIQFENSILIHRSIEDVFNYVADLENLPQWNYYVQEVHKTSSGRELQGASYHQIRKTDEQDLRISHYEPHRSLIVETIPPSRPQLKRQMLFEQKNGGTKVIDRWELESGRWGILKRLAASRVKKAVHQNLEKLKELLESGQVILQDGRRMSF